MIPKALRGEGRRGVLAVPLGSVREEARTEIGE